MIIEEAVELVPRLHRRDGLALGALLADGLEDPQRGRVHRPVGGAAEQHDIDTRRAELGGGEERGASEFGDVRQDGDADRAPHRGIGRQIPHRLGKDHVGARSDVGAGAVAGGSQAFARQRVGPGHDHERAIAARVDRGLYAVDHLLLRHQLLARAMAAALGADLVLDVHPGGTRLDHRGDGARDAEGGAPAGIDVDQHRQGGGVGDAPDIGEDIVHGADGEVGQAEGIGCNAAAGDVERLEAGRLGHARGIGIDGADHLQRPFGTHRGAQASAR